MKILYKFVLCTVAVNLCFSGGFCVAAEQGWVIKAVMASEQALAAVEAADVEDADGQVKGLRALAKARMDALQYAEAEADLKRALEIHVKAKKGITPDDTLRHILLTRARLFAGIGDAQLKQNKFQAAKENYQSGLSAAKLGVRSVSPEVKHLRMGLACATARRLTTDASASLFQQLLASSERASGFVHGDIAVILDNWIQRRASESRLGECVEMTERLVDVLKRIYGSDHPEVAEALNRQASALYANGDLQKASPLLQQAYSIRRSAFGSDHPITKRARRNLGVLQDELKAAKAK